MAVTVRIPTVLQKLARGQDEISATGGTVGEVLATVKSDYHELFTRITTDEGAVRVPLVDLPRLVLPGRHLPRRG